MAVAHRPTAGVSPFGVMPIEATDVTAARAVLALRGDIDATLSWELDVWLEVAMEGRRRVVLDVAGVRSIDAPALEVILDARERFRIAGGELLVSGAGREGGSPLGRLPADVPAGRARRYVAGAVARHAHPTRLHPAAEGGIPNQRQETR